MISSSTKTDVLTGCREFLEMIKISHTLFAMPFAIGAAFLALREMQVATQELAVLLVQIILAVALARTAAMSFNRWADRHIDAANPRTRDRSIPAGRLDASTVLLVSVLCVIGFVAVAASINPLALKLSPVVLVVILGYSWTKRFTSLCHLVLGAGLAMAPLGAWVAIRGTLLSATDQVDTTPWILAGAVMLWTAGFDILYGCLDTDFDREQHLRSIPESLGITAALRLASLLHAGMGLMLLWLWYWAQLGLLFLCATGIVWLLLFYQHRLVRPDDLGRVNRAFFNLNATISVILMAAMIIEGWPA